VFIRGLRVTDGATLEGPAWSRGDLAAMVGEDATGD
jgi:hypothetical protein